MVQDFECALSVYYLIVSLNHFDVDNKALFSNTSENIVPSFRRSETKTGRRQAVMVEDPVVAALLLVLVRAQGQRAAKLFLPPATLRSVLARCLRVLSVDAHGLAFCMA